MDLKVIEKKEEPLLSRTKITSQMNFDAATPSTKEVKSKIASSLNANEKLIIIKSIYAKFGFKKADVTAYLYKNEKEMERIAVKPKKKKAEKENAPKAEGKAKAEEVKKQKSQDTKASNEGSKE